MKKISHSFVVFIFLLVPTQLFSQQLNFQVYSVNKGLPQPQVHDVAQTENGYIWMATYGGGLVKFDGKTFVSYTTEDGLKDNLVEKVFVDSNNDLWVATDKGGVAKFQGDSLVYPIKNDSLDKYSVSDIKEMSDGSMWMGTYKGGAFILENGDVRRLTTADGLSSNIVWNVTEMQDGTIWLATDNGITIYNEGSFVKYSKSDGLAGNTIYKVLESSNGDVWVATDEGLSIWNGSSFKNFRKINGKSLDKVYDLLEKDNGEIWMAVRFQGVYIYKNGQFNQITEKNGLSTNSVYELFKDRNDNIWIATDGNGINLYKENGFLFYNKDTGLASNEILSIYRDQENTFWLGTKEGIESFDGETSQKYPLPKTYPNLNIWNIIGLPNGNKLIAMPDSLMEFDGEKYLNFSERYNLEDLYIYNLMIDSSQHLWIGADSGLYKVNLKTGNVNHFTVDDGLANNIIYEIYEDNEGRIWIGTYYGLNLFDGESFQTFRIQDGLVHNQVNCIRQDGEGDIWIGTRGGISVLKSPENIKPGNIDNFDKDDGMTLLNTHFMWFDNNGFLWQGTNGGLQRLDVDHYRKTGTMPVMHYPLSSDGIGLEFNFHALSSDGKEQAWMGSMGGLVSLKPGKIKAESILNLAVTDIKVNTKPVNWSDYTDDIIYHNGQLKFPFVTFPSDKNFFEFSFKGVSFTNPDNISYRYKLKGFKDDWMPVTEDNSAVFTNLRPGNYTFIVQAKHSGGQFSKNTAEYDFAIAFPFWQTYWFYALVLLSVMGLIFSYIRFRINTLEKERLQELVDRQTEHLTKALNEKEVLIKEIHHRVKNNLAVISGLLELQIDYANDGFVNRVLAESQRRVQSISMIHEKLYQNEKLAEINFEKYVHELIDIVSYSFSYSEKEISVNIEIDDFKLGVDQGIPCGLILNELISNAYEHAFKDQQKGTIEVVITEDDTNNLTLIVSDDGRGLPKGFDINENETLGLTLIETLCKQISGEYRFESADPGTRFVLEFQKEEALPQVPT